MALGKRVPLNKRHSLLFYFGSFTPGILAAARLLAEFKPFGGFRLATHVFLVSRD